MKFAHISDTHLGFSQFGTGERAKDVYNAFLQAIDISIKEKVEFVVFAGDIFHTPTPDGTAIINMAHALKKLQDTKIPAYFILGEHDISHAMLHHHSYTNYQKPAYHKDVMIAIDKMLRGEVDENREYINKIDYCLPLLFFLVCLPKSANVIASTTLANCIVSNKYRCIVP